MSKRVAEDGRCLKLTRAVDITQHGGGDVDCEDIIAIGIGMIREREKNSGSRDHLRIGEETNTGDQTNTDMEPPVTRGKKEAKEGR